jgi:alpha-tubulin suppressor-like RCC1 family protein
MESGQVFGWGSSKSGKLGFDMANGKNYPLPKEIISLKDLNIYSIAAGPFHTLVLASDGSIYSMGNSKDGKLGFENLKGQIVEVETPTKIDMSVSFYRYQVQKVQIKQYSLFNDYDDLIKLKPIFKQDLPFEINYIACGENF